MISSKGVERPDHAEPAGGAKAGIHQERILVFYERNNFVYIIRCHICAAQFLDYARCTTAFASDACANPAEALGQTNLCGYPQVVQRRPFRFGW